MRIFKEPNLSNDNYGKSMVADCDLKGYSFISLSIQL